MGMVGVPKGSRRSVRLSLLGALAIQRIRYGTATRSFAAVTGSSSFPSLPASAGDCCP